MLLHGRGAILEGTVCLRRQRGMLTGSEDQQRVMRPASCRQRFRECQDRARTSGTWFQTTMLWDLMMSIHPPEARDVTVICRIMV